MSDNTIVAVKGGALAVTNADGSVSLDTWINVGDEYELAEGETLVTHHKTAEKLGVGDTFKAMKEANTVAKPKKEKVADSGERAARVKLVLTEDMNYEVVNAEFSAAKTEDVRGTFFKQMFGMTNVGEFIKAATGYTHSRKDGTQIEISAEEGLRYAIRRGAIKLV